MSCLKNQDLFGFKINFNFGSHQSHQTKFGGFISIIVKLLIFCFIGQKAYSLALRSDSKIRTHSYLKDERPDIKYNETGLMVYHVLKKQKANDGPVYLNSTANQYVDVAYY